MKFFARLALLVMIVLVLVVWGRLVVTDRMIGDFDHFLVGSVFQQPQPSHLILPAPNWEPRAFCGYYPFGAAHLGFYYPPRLGIFSTLPYHIATRINVVLHHVLAAVFMYLLARAFQISPVSAALAGLVWSCGGMMVPHNTVVSIGGAWLPLIYWLLKRGVERWNLRYVFGAGLVAGLMLLTGHPQVTVFGLMGAGVFFLYDVFRTHSPRRSAKVLMLVLTPVILVGIALLVCAPQWRASVEFKKLSVRSERLSVEDLGKGSLGPDDVPSFFMPGVLEGTSLGSPYLYYVGLPPLLLAVIGFFFVRGKPWSFVKILLIVTLLLALGKYLPGFAVMQYVPVLNMFRSPSFHLLTFFMMMSLLAGAGLDFLAAFPLTELRHKAAISVVVLTIVVWLIFGALALFLRLGQNAVVDFGMHYVRNHVLTREKPAHDEDYYRRKVERIRDELVRATGISNPAVQQAAAVSLLTVIVLWLIVLKGQERFTVPLLLLAVTAGDLAFFNLRCQPMMTAAFYREEPPTATWLKERQEFPGQSRIYVFTGEDNKLYDTFPEPWQLDDDSRLRLFKLMLHPNHQIVFDLYSASGYTNVILERQKKALELLRLPDKPDKDISDSERWTRLQQKGDLLGLLNVRYVIALQPLDEGLQGDLVEAASFPFSTGEGEPGATVRIYENAKWKDYGRFLVARKASAAESADAVLGALAANPRALRDETVLEVPKEALFASAEETALVVEHPPRVVRSQQNLVEIKGDFEYSSWLVLTDTFYPGWQATVDGQETDLHCGDYLFRAVVVPQGRHTVTFVFGPSQGLPRGWILALIGLVVGIVGCIVSLQFHRPKERENLAA